MFMLKNKKRTHSLFFLFCEHHFGIWLIYKIFIANYIYVLKDFIDNEN